MCIVYHYKADFSMNVNFAKFKIYILKSYILKYFVENFDIFSTKRSQNLSKMTCKFYFFVICHKIYENALLTGYLWE